MGCGDSAEDKPTTPAQQNKNNNEVYKYEEDSAEHSHHHSSSSGGPHWSSIEGLESDVADYEDSLIYWGSNNRKYLAYHSAKKAGKTPGETKKSAPLHPEGIDLKNPVHVEFLKFEPKFKKLFKACDSNRSGDIDLEEFANFAMCFIQAQLSDHLSIQETKKNLMEIKNSPEGKEEIEEIMQKMDKNKDSTVSWDEFWEYCCSDEVRPDEAEELEGVKKVFTVWDIHKTMVIREKFLKLEPKFRKVFAQCDADNSGAIDVEEFQLFAFCYLAADLSTTMSVPEMKRAVKDIANSQEGKDEIKTLMQEIDRDGSNGVSWEEFWGHYKSETVAPKNSAGLKKINFMFNIWNAVHNQQQKPSAPGSTGTK